MSRVRSKNTKPELRVRSYLHGRGLRYRIHAKIPGRPDLVFPSRRIVLFVHGCFWHGHKGCRRATIPATRREFWKNKIETTSKRDVRIQSELEALGWTVMVIWECSITPANLDRLASKILQSPRRSGAGT
ncbi:MAG: DNA mismatch endonuclease Vsr [Pseudorhodoplanes sp.]|nr:DNA mismatch endonuclease Vsr [Pseudorhodoplanes sp.]